MMSKKAARPLARRRIRSRRWSRTPKPGQAAEVLDGKDVSFPRILSDSATPTTALAAVKDGAAGW